MYEWCSEMALHGKKAVEAFFNRYERFGSLNARRAYVLWAVPEPEQKIDPKGRKYLVPPSVFPYMWHKIEGDSDNQVSHVWYSLTLLIACRSKKVYSCMNAFWTHLLIFSRQHHPFLLFILEEFLAPPLL